MSNTRVTCIVNCDNMVIAGTMNGDLLIWSTQEIHEKVDERLHFVNKTEESNINEEGDFKSEEGEVKAESDIQMRNLDGEPECSQINNEVFELSCAKYFVNPFAGPKSEIQELHNSSRVCINQISFNSKT